MSLMEELQDHVEESDKERLNSVIQSFEAEINLCTLVNVDHQESHLEPDYQLVNDEEDSQLFSLGKMNGHNFLISFDDHDTNELVDMETVLLLT